MSTSVIGESVAFLAGQGILLLLYPLTQKTLSIKNLYPQPTPNLFFQYNISQQPPYQSTDLDS